MARFFKKRTEVIGVRPGDLVYVGSRPEQEMDVEHIRYGKDSCLRTKGGIAPESDWLSGEDRYLWMNITGISRVEEMEAVKAEFRIHPMAMADIMNTGIRPKMVVSGRDLQIVMKMFRPDEKGESYVTEQISFFLRENMLITFQEVKGDVFDSLRARLCHGEEDEVITPLLLTYLLIDRLIDNYTIVVQHLAEKIEGLEERMLSLDDDKLIEEIGRNKREIIYLRKSVLPVKEILNGLKSQKNPYYSEKHAILLNDMESNLQQILETIDIYKEILEELINSYNTRLNNKLNSIMKTLTIFSVTFIPLTFVTGIYGTNFDYIPELHMKYGYFFLWGVLIFLAGLMIGIFRRKKWL